MSARARARVYNLVRTYVDTFSDRRGRGARRLADDLANLNEDAGNS